MSSDPFSRRPASKPFSAARLAAEALFAPVAEREPAHAPGPVPRADAGVAAPSPVPSPATRGREPRVVRVERPSPAVFGEPKASADPATRPAAAPAGGDADAVAMPRPPRRKRRQLHGEVVVIRPPAASEPTADASVQDLGVARVVALAEGLPAHEPPRGEAAFTDDSWPRYPALRARIRALEAEAEALRQREAAEAIAWIRSALKTYGIEADELGMP